VNPCCDESDGTHQKAVREGLGTRLASNHMLCNLIAALYKCQTLMGLAWWSVNSIHGYDK
jgi:hypothetical protein